MAKITVAYFRYVYKEFVDEKITMSRMVEKLNERAESNERCKICKMEFSDLDMKLEGSRPKDICCACFTSNA